MFFLLLETIGLQRAVLPWKYSGMHWTYGRPAMGIPRVELWYPDLFTMLMPQFWIPTLTFLTTSLLLPSLFGYFFNLTGVTTHSNLTTHSTHSIRRNRPSVTVSATRYTIDPFIFNLVKGLVTTLVYMQGAGEVVVGSYVVEVLERGMFGGMGTVVRKVKVGIQN